MRSQTESESGHLPMSLQPGTRLGSYEVTALIGHGGMGEVYRARDTDSRRFFGWQPLLLCGVI